MLNYKEKIALISDHADEFGHQYKKGQTGITGNAVTDGDTKVIVLFDGYIEAKQRARKMREEDGEGPNVVEYLAEIPINILVKIKGNG